MINLFKRKYMYYFSFIWYVMKDKEYFKLYLVPAVNIRFTFRKYEEMDIEFGWLCFTFSIVVNRYKLRREAKKKKAVVRKKKARAEV